MSLSRRRVLLVGATGQVGRTCERLLPAEFELVSLSHADLDISDERRVGESVDRIRPDVLINAAAYTAVDKAETDADAAMRANEHGPRHLAGALARLGSGRLIHLSTDFVFDGHASSPYAPDAPTGPLCVYGRSKLAGERAVLESLPDRAVILRTAWVYSSVGHNFMLTMLRLMKRGPVRVVTDQVGTPTSAVSLAIAIWRIAASSESGIYHWSDAGVASWYDFAVAIAEEAAAHQLLEMPVDVVPISTAEYPTAARRPAYSVLDKAATIRTFGVTPQHWRTRLRDVIQEVSRA